MTEMFIGYIGIIHAIREEEERPKVDQKKEVQPQRVRDLADQIERRAFEKEMHHRGMKELLMSGLRREIYGEMPVSFRKNFLCFSWEEIVVAAQDAEWLWCLRNKQPYYYVDSEKRENNTKGFTVDEDDYVVVYTDGACLKNGKPNAQAGIGVWFDDEHYLNVSKPLNKSDSPTYNVALVKAAIEALELVKQYGANRVAIHTNSKYLISSVTNYIYKWLANGWMKSDGRTLKHKKEFRDLLNSMEDLDIKWVYVKAHKNSIGSMMADGFARKGACRYGIGNKQRSDILS